MLVRHKNKEKAGEREAVRVADDKVTHWVTLSIHNTKVLHQSFTPNLKSDC